MKKLILTLCLLFIGCTTINIKSNTLESCMKEVRERTGLDKIKLSPEEEINAEDGLFLVCDDAKNDPDLAMGILDEIRYSH